ncbi:MAG TPA: hypothetical protein VFS22_09555 [Flavisolibacter sp.]|nr:hypothetical protein [Flavisolibacter sp.]
MGRIAWIGLPKKLDDVLPKVINGTWRIEEAMANRKREMEVRILDDKVAEALNPYMGHPGKPDSAILVIQKILNEHPELKYAPRLGHFYIYSLVKTDTEKAYRYGKELMAARMPDDPPYQSISDAVYYITEVAKKEVPGKLYELGAEALQAQIDNYPWSMDIPVTYDNIAAWYFRAGRRDKAVEAEEKAIEAIKKNMVTKAALPVLETKLQNYKRI